MKSLNESDIAPLGDQIKELYATREEILKAFIAKYGCGPEEVTQIIQNTLEGTKWWVEMKKKGTKRVKKPKPSY